MQVQVEKIRQSTECSVGMAFRFHFPLSTSACKSLLGIMEVGARPSLPAYNHHYTQRDQSHARYAIITMVTSAT